MMYYTNICFGIFATLYSVCVLMGEPPFFLKIFALVNSIVFLARSFSSSDY